MNDKSSYKRTSQTEMQLMKWKKQQEKAKTTNSTIQKRTETKPMPI